MAGRLVLSQFAENLLETLHQITQIRINLRESRNNVISRRFHPARHHWEMRGKINPGMPHAKDGKEEKV